MFEGLDFSLLEIKGKMRLEELQMDTGSESQQEVESRGISALAEEVERITDDMIDFDEDDDDDEDQVPVKLGFVEKSSQPLLRQMFPCKAGGVPVCQLALLNSHFFTCSFSYYAFYLIKFTYSLAGVAGSCQSTNRKVLSL